MQYVDAFVDVKNQVCTQPVLEVQKKLKVLRKGQVLEVLVNPKSKDDIIRIFGTIKKHDILGVEAHESHYRILIRKV